MLLSLPSTLLFHYILSIIMCNCLLVDKFHDLGLSILYNRMLVLSMQLGNSVCMKFESDGVVCPTKLLSNVFTTFAVDNTDENPSSHSTRALAWNCNFINTAPPTKNR